MTATGFRIQPRDRQLVRDLFLHRFVTRDQLLSLGYFGSVPRCNNRMAGLVRAGWVRRLTRVNGLGIAQSLFAPGPTASIWLPESLDLDPQDVAQQCRTSAGPLLVEHSVRALDFRLRVGQDARALGVELESWLCELECRHEFRFRSGSSMRWRSVIVKPDGFVRLMRGKQQLDCFVEIDLGHVALPRFAKKLSAYSDYLTSGAFAQAYESDRFAVLTVTTGERRLAHLAKLGDVPFHLVTTWDRLSKGSLFDSIWSSRAKPDLRLTDLMEASLHK